MRAADEFIVGASHRREELELPQLRVHQPVHVVSLRRGGPAETGDILHEGQVAGLDVLKITHAHGHLSAGAGADGEALGRDRGQRFIRADIHGEPRDVAGSAVGELRQHLKLLRVIEILMLIDFLLY